MIRIRFAALVTSIVLPLGGCGGGADGTGNGNGPQPGASSRYLYVSSYSDASAGVVSGQIYGYTFDPGANSLSEVGGSPFPGSTPGPSIPSLGR